MVVSLDSQFSGPAAVLVEEINLAESLDGLTFDNLFTNVKGISPFYFVLVKFSFVNMFFTLGWADFTPQAIAQSIGDLKYLRFKVLIREDAKGLPFTDVNVKFSIILRPWVVEPWSSSFEVKSGDHNTKRVLNKYFIWCFKFMCTFYDDNKENCMTIRRHKATSLVSFFNVRFCW